MKLLFALALLCACSVAAFAQPVVVADTLFLPNGSRYSGSLSISWPTPFTGGDGRQIPSGPAIQVTVTNGVLSVSLEANSTATPAGTSYQVTYRPAGTAAITENWVITCCTSPQGLSSVRVAVPPSPSFLIALSQISQSGATNGQCPVWSTGSLAWIPGSCGGVTSVFTRTGAVVATSGDYTAAQVTNAFDRSADNLLGAHVETFTDISTPANPTAGLTKTYSKGGKLCSLDSSGNENCTGGAGGSGITQLTGDVTAGPGSGSVSATIAAAAVTLAKQANLAANSIQGNNTGSPATPLALTATQVTAMLNSFSSSLQGLAPASGGGTNNFLRADGSWAAPTAAGAFADIVISSTYNWTPQTPGGTLSSGIGNTVTLIPCPLGVAGSDLGHYYRISGGTGTAEAVLGSGGSCTSGAGSGTITFVPANNHTGAWTIGPASSGIQEAGNISPHVYIPAGSWPVYAPIRACTWTISGAGKFATVLQAQGAAVGIINAPCTRDNISQLGVTATVQQTAGGYGIRLGNGGGAENTFTKIDSIYCEPLYDCILGINASQTWVTNSVFYNFSHTGVTGNDTTNPDFDGPWISDNVFFNYNLSTPALACVYLTSTGASTIANNKCFGGGLSPAQLQANVYLNQTQSTQVTITGNVLETVSVVNVWIVGVFNLITITGNSIGQPTTNSNLWRAIQVNGNNTTSFCGTGIGICQGAITGNVIQGPGASSTNSLCIELVGFVSDFLISSNVCKASQQGINVGSNVTNSTIGPHTLSNIFTQPVGGGSSTTVWNMTAPVTFATLPTAANSSLLYCTDCKNLTDDSATFDATISGSGHGTNALRENAAWRVH